ncbi:MAG: hypothetical protein FH756_02345 [Firmicutes bacterium]|nr:hypothetical protein [Bacillota bacterium]
MGKKASEVNENKKTAGEPTFTIEDLAQKHPTPAWVMAGLKTAYGWGEGKKLTEKQFIEAKDKWLRGPMRRKVK